jgi:hypothetical protein
LQDVDIGSRCGNRRSVDAGGVFHPKITVLTAPDECHLLVGSGNLTFGGWGGNFEVIDARPKLGNTIWAGPPASSWRLRRGLSLATRGKTVGKQGDLAPEANSSA